MASLDHDPIPPWAITCWTNDREIFVALPMKAGSIPYIISYPLNDGGLSQALKVLRKQLVEAPRPTAEQPANYLKPPVQPQVKLSKAQEKLHAETTPEQRSAAQELIRKLGLIK